MIRHVRPRHDDRANTSMILPACMFRDMFFGRHPARQRRTRNSCASPIAHLPWLEVGNQGSRKHLNSHIDASHSRQPLVKGERLVRYEVNAVMLSLGGTILSLVLKALD